MLRKKLMRTFIQIALLLPVSASVFAQTVKLNEPLAPDTAVTIGRLPNGLTYYIKPNAKPAQIVELRLVVKAGSMMENDNQQGLAHFMEHMEFNGLKHYPKNELVDYLEKIGVRFGADLNANTGWDRTYYLLPIPTDKPGNLKRGFQIVGDWAGGALITGGDVNDERQVIMEELRMRDKNAKTRMMRKYLPAMLNDSRYAYRLSGGRDSIVQFADPKLIREFYQDWYRPDLMAVIVVGDVTVPQAELMIKKYFGSLENPKNVRPRTYDHIPAYTTKKAMIVTDSETTSYSFTLMYPAHKVELPKTTGDLRQELIKDIFVQCVNRKLRDLAQTGYPPFSNASLSLSGEFGSISLADEGLELAVTPIDNLQTSIDGAIGEMINIEQYGFTDADIQTVLKGYVPAYENAYKERNNTPSAAYADEFADNFMKGDPIVNITDEYNYVKQLLPTITTVDINAFAKQTLSAPPVYFTMITGPANGKLTLPNTQRLLQMVETSFNQQAKKSTIQITHTTLLTQQPRSGRIISETTDKTLNTTTYTLSNGIKVTTKATDFKNDQVLFSGVKCGGTGLYGVPDKSNTTFLKSLIGTMGYGQFSPVSLNDYLSGKQVSVGTAMGDLTDDISGNSSVKDLSTMLELTYLELTQPRKDTVLLKGWLTKLNARLPLLKADPQNAFQDSLTKVLYSENPLEPIVIPTKKEIADISVDRVMAIYKEQFGNARGFHFFFVGNIHPDTLKPLIEKYLASLPVANTESAYMDNGVRMTDGNKTFKFYGGSDQKSVILDIYHGEVKYSPSLALKANMLAQVMTIELLKKVREQMAAIYSGGFSASVTKLPYGHYSLVAQMPCGPENVDKILAELDREVEDYKKNGVSQEDLDKVKKAMIEQYKEAVKDNSTWASELQQIYFWNSNPNDFLNYIQRVNNVTPAELKATASELLSHNNFKALTYPENK